MEIIILIIILLYLIFWIFKVDIYIVDKKILIYYWWKNKRIEWIINLTN